MLYQSTQKAGESYCCQYNSKKKLSPPINQTEKANQTFGEQQDKTPTEVKKPIVKASKANSEIKKNPPKINSNIDSLISNIRKKELEKDNLKKALSIEGIMRIWEDYSKTLESQSILVAFKNARLEVQGKDIKINVPSELIKEKINAEKDLLRIIQDNFIEETNLIYDIRPDLFPGYKTKTVKKILTNKEKYDALLEKNPNIEILMNKLKLKYNNS